MPKPTKGPRLGGSPAHERMILANLATALFEHRKITTTETKAKRLRPFAERLVTKAKRGDLAARRQVLAVIRDKGVVHTLFTEIGPSFATRPGGYTRVTKLGPRKGDNAPMAVIELVEPMPESTGPSASAATGSSAGAGQSSAPAKKAAKKSAAKKSAEAPAASETETAADDTAADDTAAADKGTDAAAGATDAPAEKDES